MKRLDFASGTRLPVPSQVAIGALVAIAARNGGRIVPAEVVAAAKPPRHPLHGCFTWDDTVAAQKHREEEARRLIRAVVVREMDGDTLEEPVRAYVNIRTLEDSDYRSVVDVLADDELAEKLLARALAEARSWNRRYRSLQQLWEVCRAIDEVVDRIAI